MSRNDRLAQLDFLTEWDQRRGQRWGPVWGGNNGDQGPGDPEASSRRQRPGGCSGNWGAGPPGRARPRSGGLSASPLHGWGPGWGASDRDCPGPCPQSPSAPAPPRVMHPDPHSPRDTRTALVTSPRCSGREAEGPAPWGSQDKPAPHAAHRARPAWTRGRRTEQGRQPPRRPGSVKCASRPDGFLPPTARGG